MSVYYVKSALSKQVWQPLYFLMSVAFEMHIFAVYVIAFLRNKGLLWWMLTTINKKRQTVVEFPDVAGEI